jgi:pimeloyl-ACP methyl ester carboxylesterase
MSMPQMSPSRRSLLTGAVGLGLSGALAAASCRQRTRTSKESTMAATQKPSIVFAHGIWADGSSFSKVIPLLRAQGHEVIAAQYGLDTLKGDVDRTVQTFSRVSGPIVLVGHSYGGTVITAAGMNDRVKALVYICALAPDETETSQSIQEKYPQTDVLKHIEVADGRIWLKPDAIRYFAGDLSQEEQGVVWSTHFAPAADLFTQKVAGTAWRTKPSWYIVGKQDHTVQPDLERFLAKRMNAKTTELDSSHVAMLSKPREVVDIIRAAAEAVAPVHA